MASSHLAHIYRVPIDVSHCRSYQDEESTFLRFGGGGHVLGVGKEKI